MRTAEQRMCKFYIGWFNRVYVPTDSGWVVSRTPDNAPITQQDAYFWFALEVVAREMNIMRANEIAKMSAK